MSTLFLLVAICGIVVGWLVERHRLGVSLRHAQAENRLMRAQVEALQRELSAHYRAVQIHYWWADADEFVKMLMTVSDDMKFLEMAPSLARADEDVFRESVNAVTLLLDAGEERTRLRALICLRFMQELAPDRLADQAPSIVRRVIPLLDARSPSVLAEALGCCRAFGPAARDALPALERRMSDDEDWYAPDAAVTVAAIDPTVDIGPRLLSLVRGKHPNWYQAAFQLPKHVDAETARRVLIQVYEDAVDDAERSMAVQAMNQIPAEGERTVGAEADAATAAF